MDVTIYFPSLKKLQLVSVGYDSEEFLTYLFSGCPVLEELIVQRMMMSACRLSSPTLTRLVIDSDISVGVRLDTPALRYFRVCVSMTRYIIPLTRLSSLSELDIDMKKGNFPHFGCTIELLYMVWNVNCLTLSTVGIKIQNLSWFSALRPKFHNLTELKMHADWVFINFFLENANNLRVLTVGRMVDHNTQCWTEPKQVPACLISHLENIYLVDFEWSMKHEFDMVKYFLENAKILKKMEIIDSQQHEHCSHEKLEAINRLALFEQGSQSCRIAFV